LLNGYPRMGAQLAKVEDATGRVALGVHAGAADESDARLASWLQKRGTTVHEASGRGEADATAVLSAMVAAGMHLEDSNAVAAVSSAEEVAAATKVQAVKRGNDERDEAGTRLLALAAAPHSRSHLRRRPS